MVALGAKAARQVEQLRSHFEENGRPEATRNLILALQRARDRIGQDPHAGLAAPRPYPSLAHPGERWIKEGRYWFTHTLASPPMIIAVFFETADIPGRSSAGRP